jgi:predicted naringenin-chalcone synthase
VLYNYADFKPAEMSVIVNIATAVPENKFSQAVLAEFMGEALQYDETEKKKLRLLYAKSGIETRYSVIPDYGSRIEERRFFPKTTNLVPFPDLEQRMALFNKTAPSLCLKVIEECLKNKVDKSQVTHLITVSCTGLAAPGLDIEIVQQMQLNENINRTSVNFMGCYAAIHALKQADYICKSDPDAIVLVVCVELCSIHFQKINDPDNITANLLFADGAAAALILPDELAKKRNLHGFAMQKFHSHIELNGKSDMAWQLSSHGFLMTLSAYIPQLLESGIKHLFDKAIEKLDISQQDITHWAIHPGGKKILEVIQEQLGLSKHELESSYNVLSNYGNMSSSTVLFVLKDIMDRMPKAGEKAFSVAFGPGLTMESLILEYV